MIFHYRTNLSSLISAIQKHLNNIQIMYSINFLTSESEAADGGGGQDAHQSAEARHHDDQIGRDEQRDRGADASDVGAEPVHRESSDALQRDQRDADGAERDRRGVGEQADAGGVERRESEAGEHGGGHGDRRAEARGAFDEGSEGEGDQQGLKAMVVGQAADGVLDDLEFTGVDGDAVEHDRRKDDPADGEQAERRAVSDGAEHVRNRHLIAEQSRQNGGAQSAEAGDPGWFPHHAKQDQQGDDGQGGDQRR